MTLTPYLTLLFAMLFVVLNCHGAATGGRKQLSDVELTEDQVSKVSKFATQQIHKKKLKNAEYDECIILTHKVLRGTKQIVSGVKYSFEMRVSPELLQTDACAQKKSANKLLKTMKPEICEAEVLWKPWSEVKMSLLRSVCLKVED